MIIDSPISKLAIYLKDESTANDLTQALKIAINSVYGVTAANFDNPFGIKRVIFNGPATIVFWLDGTKTVVKCAEGETNDKKTSILWAYAKKICGTSSHMNKVLDKLVEE